MEKELVRKLGEQIGYGNMMQLASECWKESMTEKGYPTSGVFIPALPCDVRKEEPTNDAPAGGLSKHDVIKSVCPNCNSKNVTNWSDGEFTCYDCKKHWQTVL